ncbi:hypothetical protein [Neosynechococcus sphagnicola]|uniref:hypothetical protein n=1 Tax=Neosynechococcus sphagnicola TaxID=1501145 RepID=UPI00055FC4AE|nr:hypothetical protein [Neosynechococcus sphagnicola]
MQASEGDTLARIEALVEKNAEAISKHQSGLDKAETRFDAYVKASERVERLATTIIITAGTVTLLSPLLQSIAPTIRAFIGGAA